MNRSSFAFLVALLIHLLLMILFWFLGTLTPEFKKPPHEKKIKVSLKELPKQQKQTEKPKEPVVPIEKIPPITKGKQLKEIVELPSVEYKPEAKPKEVELNPKPKAQKDEPAVKKIQPIPEENTHIPLLKQKKEITASVQEPKKPMSWLYEDKSSQDKVQEETKSISGASAGKDIKELYGVDWDKLSPGEQKYILDNKEIMRRITQEVLNRQARVSDINDLNVNRVNIIEFYLHPNGDMSDFKFLQNSGYFILDDITKATIEYAYSKYPRPTEKTLIRYNVFYNLKHY